MSSVWSPLLTKDGSIVKTSHTEVKGNNNKASSRSLQERKTVALKVTRSKHNAYLKTYFKTWNKLLVNTAWVTNMYFYNSETTWEQNWAFRFYTAVFFNFSQYKYGTMSENYY